VPTQHIVKNRILRQLSAEELRSIQPWVTALELRANTVLQEQGAAIDHIYFPSSGMVSLLAIMQNGEAIETGIIGADGVLGGDAPINGHLSTQATVQLDGAALKMPKAQFVDVAGAQRAGSKMTAAGTNAPSQRGPVTSDYGGQTGREILRLSSSQFDPTRTSGPPGSIGTVWVLIRVSRRAAGAR
jgi:hypothetical protein